MIASLALLPIGCGKKAADGSRRAAAAAQVQYVEVVPVEQRDLIESLNLVGSIAANESAQIRAEVAGVVREILFQEGELVTRGQVLLKIDDSELRAQTEEAEAAFRLAQINVERADRLIQIKNITQADNDRAHAEFKTAQAKLALQRSRLEKSAVKAPFDGTVGARAISPGDYVNNQTTIATVDDLSRLKIEFDVPEAYLAKVHPGTSFRIQSRGLASASPIVGEVYFIGATISRETRSSGAKGFLTQPPTSLKPGMFADVELVLDVRKHALTVPESALTISGGKAQIAAVRTQDGTQTIDFIPVTIGLRSRGYAEISPLKPGALVAQQPVVASGVGAISLFQGAKVETRPLRKELLPERTD